MCDVEDVWLGLAQLICLQRLRLARLEALYCKGWWLGLPSRHCLSLTACSCQLLLQAAVVAFPNSHVRPVSLFMLC